MTEMNKLQSGARFVEMYKMDCDRESNHVGNNGNSLDKLSCHYFFAGLMNPVHQLPEKEWLILHKYLFSKKHLNFQSC
ncbi:MAG: hypothetical protein ACI9FD_001159 [Gammaproteobacteria bacterium]|jgi:hypothetical protein